MEVNAVDITIKNNRNSLPYREGIMPCFVAKILQSPVTTTHPEFIITAGHLEAMCGVLIH